MSSVMKYKDYIGSVEFSEEDQLFYGKVLGIHSLISYEGESAKELIQDFHEAVDDYLEFMCRKKNRAGKSLQRLFQCTNLARSSSFHCYPCHSRWNDSTILIYLLCVMAMQVFCLYKFQHLGNPEIRVF